VTIALVALLFGLPAAAFTLWPLLTHPRARALLPVPPDSREQLREQKRQALRALRELEFEHEAGHVSDDDYAELRARYEAEAAQIFTELDRLDGAAPAPAPPVAAVPAEATRRGFRHPLALAAAAVTLVVFGIALGVGIVRYSEPEAGAGMTGGGPMTTMPQAPAAGAPAAGGASRTVPPEMLQGMLGEGRYGEAIAAYQAVLKRDPQNVDAMTHLGLIVAIGGHADSALETFDKALGIDPNYAPALLFRGQVLYESKRDARGAIASWEKFLKIVPAGEDHDRVKALIAAAKKAPRN
jgi:tetratricopeptide (TPR) repeat protein